MDKFIYLWLPPFPCRQICTCHWIRQFFSPESESLRLEGTSGGPCSSLLLKAGSAMSSDHIAWGCIHMGLENLKGWILHKPSVLLLGCPPGESSSPLIVPLVLKSRSFPWHHWKKYPGWPESGHVAIWAASSDRGPTMLSVFPGYLSWRVWYTCPSQHTSCASHPTMSVIPTMWQFCDCMWSFSSSCLFMMLTWMSSGG